MNQKINNLKIASELAGYQAEPKDLEVLTCLYELILNKGSDTTVDDILKVKHHIEEKYKEQSPKPIIIEQHLKFEVYPNDLGEYNWQDAKSICEDLGDGWRLPTREELHLMWLNRDTIGGFAAAYYWSSCEFNNFNAWYQHFFDGNQYFINKDYTYHVRAVRERNVNDGN